MNTDIIEVSDAIDGLLDRPRWTRREFEFYQMLVSKVREYRSHLPSQKKGPLKDLSSDIAEIYGNIKLQPWYQKSNNKGTIAGLFQNMKIVDCKHQGDPEAHNYHYRLDLLIRPENSIRLIMDVARDARSSDQYPYHFRIYYELGGNKGHITAYTPGKSKCHTLPEYNHLSRIFPSLERHEIICLAIELVLYYDVDGLMGKLPIGNSYPVTLTKLMKGIIDGICA
jgi:hypothetical protein